MSDVKTVIIDLIKYNIHNDFVVVVGAEPRLPSDIKILPYVNGLPVVCIEKQAFANRGIVNIELPKTIEIIETEAFKGCRNLEKVNFPQNLKGIGRSAFIYCSNLSSVTIPGKTHLGTSVFFGCINLKEVILMNGIQNIPQRCFFQSPVEEVTIPRSVKDIGFAAFNKNVEGFTVICYKDSIAEKWGREAGAKIEYKDSQLNIFLKENTSKETIIE